MLVRTDLRLVDQVVQAGHACLAAAWQFQPPPTPCHLVVLGVPSPQALEQACQRLDQAGIAYTAFAEPDRELGRTAVCTTPITGRERTVFRRYPLWSALSSDCTCQDSVAP